MSNNVRLQVLLKAVDQASRPFKHIQTASRSLSANIRTTQQDLKKLNAQARRIEGFRESSAQLAVTGRALQKAKQDANALAVSLRNTVNPTRAQVQVMDAAKRSAAELQLKYNGLRQSVHRQRQELTQAGINTRTLANDERRLRASISDTTNQLNRQREALVRVSQQQARLSSVQQRYQAGKQVASNVAGMGAAGVGVATAGLYATGRFIAPGVGFDKQMSGTQAILGLDKSDEKLQAIRQQARDIGATTAFSPGDVARTQTTLAKSGYDADSVLAATGSTVNLSLAADVDIAQAADIITNMQSAFNLANADIERIADVMTKGFTEAFAPIGALFTPLKPMFDALGGWLKQAWQWFTDLLKPVKSSQESLERCKNAGVEFGRSVADALMLPLKAFNKLRQGIDWVLEKLGIINNESSDIDKKAQKANDYASGVSGGGGYYPIGGAMPGTYVPVSAGGGKSYTDNSVNNFHVASSHPGGMTEAQTKRMLLQVVEERERKARAAQRSTLASD